MSERFGTPIRGRRERGPSARRAAPRAGKHEQRFSRPPRAPAHRRHRRRAQDPGRDRRRGGSGPRSSPASRHGAARSRSFDPTELARPLRRARSATSTRVEYFGPKEVRRQDRVTHLGFAAAADAHQRRRRARRRPGPVRGDRRDRRRWAHHAPGELRGLLRPRVPSRVSPFFVPMMMPNATAGRDLDALRMDRSDVLHLDRVRGRRQRHRRGCAADPRRAPPTS